MKTVDVAYYQWAVGQVEREIASNCEFVRSLRTEIGWRFVKVLERLPEKDRLRTWKALLKRFHIAGAEAVGDPISDEDRFALDAYSRQMELSFAILEPRPFSSNRVARSQIKKGVLNSLTELLKVKPNSCGGNLFRFDSNQRDCVLHTYLYAGSRNYQICYWHSIIGQGGIIRERCSVLEWLGISSQTHWDEVSAETMPQMITSLSTAVRMFLGFFAMDWERAVPKG